MAQEFSSKSQCFAIDPFGSRAMLNPGNLILNGISSFQVFIQNATRLPFPNLNLAKASTFSQAREMLTQGLLNSFHLFHLCAN